ncbi:hypothetical protein VKT23_012767 [Stygiomarasmius scandens]|uniref:Uncharacterized protein n=1 Tax=Marasmiellus scandens TaxID=2682957 RepID=A0ABR1J7U2_9AGAR
MDGEQVLKGKASFSFGPTPPSPTDSIPPLTNSASNSSNSPPQPTTPPKYPKSRSRYPNDLGRVPLHRRGTSQRYEPFEDLLREAGYKETRIFTPESERKSDVSNAGEAGNDAKNSVRAVGAVVGFLTGLMPGPGLKRSTSLRQSYSTPDESPTFAIPDSPTPSRRAQESSSSSRRRTERTSNSKQSSTSSLEGLGDATPKPLYPRQNSRPTTPLSHHRPTSRGLPYSHNNSSYTSLNHHHQHRYHYESSINSRQSGSGHGQARSERRNPTLHSNQTGHHSQIRPTLQPLSPLPQSSNEPRQITHTIYHPVPSRASAYLRHMASVPNIPHRPNSTPAHQSLVHAQQQQNRGMFRSRTRDQDDEELFSPLYRGNGEAEEDAQPPMPKTWLETVARAVLFGGAGAFVGGPAANVQSQQQRSASNGYPIRQTPALRQTRSVITRAQAHERDMRHDLPSATTSSLHRSRSGLSDHTNRGPPYTGERLVKSAAPVIGRTHAPPELLSKVGRATTSEGEVRRTRVVCRSAPTSRAASPVKGRSGDRQERKTKALKSRNADVSDHKSAAAVDRGRKDRKELGSGPVPSLARTRLEGDDVWHRRKSQDKRTRRDRGNKPYTYDWNGGNDVESDVSFSPSEDEDDDDEDGELNLARMLVPPKRQNSIHSLRKHLTGTHDHGVIAPASSVISGGSSGMVRRGSTRSSAYGSGNSRSFRQWVAGRRMSEHWEDEDEEDEPEGPWLVGASREEMQRRLVAEHEALERFLNDDVGQEQLSSQMTGTRRGLPSQWVDTTPEQ